MTCRWHIDRPWHSDRLGLWSDCPKCVHCRSLPGTVGLIPAGKWSTLCTWNRSKWHMFDTQVSVPRAKSCQCRRSTDVVRVCYQSKLSRRFRCRKSQTGSSQGSLNGRFLRVHWWCQRCHQVLRRQKERVSDWLAFHEVWFVRRAPSFYLGAHWAHYMWHGHKLGDPRQSDHLPEIMQNVRHHSEIVTHRRDGTHRMTCECHKGDACWHPGRVLRGCLIARVRTQIAMSGARTHSVVLLRLQDSIPYSSLLID